MQKCAWRPRRRKEKVKQKPKPLQVIRLLDGEIAVQFQLQTPLIDVSHLIRELNKVYTNGTLVDAEFLTDEQAGHCVSICESSSENIDGTNSDAERQFGICILDCSTSEFNLSSFHDDICRTKLETLMRQICPKELLFKKVSKIFSSIAIVIYGGTIRVLCPSIRTDC